MNATSDGRAAKRLAINITADGGSEIRSELRNCLGEMGDDELKRMVVENHDLYGSTARQAIRVYAQQAGLALLEMKRRVKHGEWGRWVRDNFDFSSETASVYMRVAARWDDIEAAGMDRAGITLADLREFTSNKAKADDDSEPTTVGGQSDDEAEGTAEVTPSRVPARMGTAPKQFRMVLPYNQWKPFSYQLDALGERLKREKEDILISLVRDAYDRLVEGGAE